MVAASMNRFRPPSLGASSTRTTRSRMPGVLSCAASPHSRDVASAAVTNPAMAGQPAVGSGRWLGGMAALVVLTSMLSASRGAGVRPSRNPTRLIAKVGRVGRAASNRWTGKLLVSPPSLNHTGTNAGAGPSVRPDLNAWTAARLAAARRSMVHSGTALISRG